MGHAIGGGKWRSPRKPKQLDTIWGFVFPKDKHWCGIQVWDSSLSLDEVKVLKEKLDAYIAWAEYRRKAEAEHRRSRK